MIEIGSSTYYGQTVPGVETIAWRELQARSPGARLLGYRRIRDKNGLLLFTHPGSPAELLQLGCTEDIFSLVAHETGIPLEHSGLWRIEEVIRQAKHLEAGLRLHRQIRGKRGKKRTSFRVIARKEGADHRYRRVDAQRAVEHGILRRYNYKWLLVKEQADLEIWFTLFDREALYGLRLSDATMRHRSYKLRHLPASLRPTVAYAMVFLSDPQPDDVVMDPMCGAGTILIERARAGRYGLLLGGDIDPEAVLACQENVGPRYKPIQIRQWDATQLPLEEHSVDKVVCNLPFGEQIGSHADNAVLYPRFFQEMLRVVRPGGRLVLLSGERRLVRGTLARQPGLRLAESFDVQILGRPAMIWVLDLLHK